MLRALYADTRRLLRSSYFHYGMVQVLLLQLLLLLVLYLVVVVLMKESLIADDVCYFFPFVAPFWVTAHTLKMTEREFSDGCIRNKIIAGVKRREACLSAVLTGMLQGLMYSLMACLSSLATSVFFFGGFTEITPSENANIWLVITLGCIAVGAFSTVLIMIFGGKKISYVIGLALSFGYMVFYFHIQNQLYPASGLQSLSGTKLAVYEFLDKYIPYSWFYGAPRHPLWVYWVGCTGLIILTMLAGTGAFHKKELS